MTLMKLRASISLYESSLSKTRGIGYNASSHHHDADDEDDEAIRISLYSIEC